MAKIYDNMVVRGLSGALGRQLVVRHDKAGRTIVGNWPKFKATREFSETQIAHENAFREAAAYAQSAKDQPIYTSKAIGTALSAYNVALADWFHASEIKALELGSWKGQPGQLIRIKALDDVLVKQVSVTITSAAGAVLEKGDAVQTDSMWWEYTTTANGSGNLTVTAAAQDMPGNVTEMSKSSA